jgi:hypothetical protein
MNNLKKSARFTLDRRGKQALTQNSSQFGVGVPLMYGYRMLKLSNVGQCQFPTLMVKLTGLRSPQLMVDQS